MQPVKAAWGIELGEFALKALRLQLVGDQVTVTEFAVIQHQKVLSDPSVTDRAGMIRVTLGAFVQEHAEQLANEPIVMSLPGNVGFARFATMPAVDAKTLRSMVEYEAKQQIPFPIEEVEWDSHVLPADENGQCAIGIFAVTKDRLIELLTLYADCGIEPDILTLSSVAAYNALTYDLDLSESSDPIACLDIGTNSSDLIVMAGGKFWIRTFPVGGSQFTSAIAEAFASQNVNYTRAEKIKVDRSATEQILRARTMAMRRVTSQLVDEVGRSREFYQAANEGVELKRLYGVGSTLKISGLRTKIAGDLQVTFDRLEEFKRIQLNGPDAADFAAHSINLLTALGLGLQGLGLAKVELNLSPMARIRRKIWKSKTPWFIAAAAILIVTSVALFLRVALDQIQLSQMADIAGKADNTIKQGESLVKQLQALQVANGMNASDANALALVGERNVWPFLVNDTYSALNAARPDAVELGSDPTAIMKIPVGNRRLVRLEEFSGVHSVKPETGIRQIVVSARITLSTLLGPTDKDPTRFFNEANGVLEWLKVNHDRPDAPYTIEAESLVMPKWSEIIGDKRTEQLTQDDGGNGAGLNGQMTDQAPASATQKSGGGELMKDRTQGSIEDSSGGFRPNLGSGDQAAGGDSAAGDGSNPTGTASGGSRSPRTIVVSAEEKLPSVDLEKEAPFPQEPKLIGSTEKKFEGVLTFRVTLRSSAAPPQSSEQ